MENGRIPIPSDPSMHVGEAGQAEASRLIYNNQYTSKHILINISSILLLGVAIATVSADSNGFNPEPTETSPHRHSGFIRLRTCHSRNETSETSGRNARHLTCLDSSLRVPRLESA